MKLIKKTVKQKKRHRTKSPEAKPKRTRTPEAKRKKTHRDNAKRKKDKDRTANTYEAAGESAEPPAHMRVKEEHCPDDSGGGTVKEEEHSADESGRTPAAVAVGGVKKKVARVEWNRTEDQAETATRGRRGQTNGLSYSGGGFFGRAKAKRTD